MGFSLLWLALATTVCMVTPKSRATKNSIPVRDGACSAVPPSLRRLASPLSHTGRRADMRPLVSVRHPDPPTWQCSRSEICSRTHFPASSPPGSHPPWLAVVTDSTGTRFRSTQSSLMHRCYQCDDGFVNLARIAARPACSRLQLSESTSRCIWSEVVRQSASQERVEWSNLVVDQTSDQ